MNLEGSKESLTYCVVVLHYLSIDETINCISSIKNVKNSLNIKIVVVDNASPNETGKRLIDIYANDVDVEVVVLNENIGFAKANNIGYKYCIKKYSPDYIVIVNNDIEFYQKDFFQIINNLYKEKHYSVLGPDIYNTSNNIHQSPLRERGYNTRELKKSIFLRKYIIRVNQKKPLAYYSYKIIKKVKGLVKKDNRALTNSKGYDVVQYNPVIYGACVIYSKEYIKRHNLAFCPVTFMYFEEEFLWYMLQTSKELILYSPAFSIKHKHNGSTIEAYTNVCDRTIFKESCAIDSAKQLINYIEKGCLDFE